MVKVFKGKVYEQLYAYLEARYVIQTSVGLSCYLFNCYWLTPGHIEIGKINAVIFLDLKKTFDTVDHKIPLFKINHCGINEDSLKWFQLYFENRTQQCSVGGSLSDSLATSLSVAVNGTRVKQVASAKSLGVKIDDKLSWNYHFEKLTKKIAFGIGAMKRVKTCKRWQAAHLNRRETFENLLHIAPLRRTLSGILQFKIWTMI